MEEAYTRNNIRTARRFLNRLGLEYDTMSPSTKKYLLDLQPSAPTNASSMMVSTLAAKDDAPPSPSLKGEMKMVSNKFNTIVNTDMEMRGGYLVLPSEYFGVDSGAYLSATGGAGTDARKGMYTRNDLKLFKNAYEKKYMRKLRMSAAAHDHALCSLNNYVDTSVIRAVRKGKGRLTKGGMHSEMIQK